MVAVLMRMWFMKAEARENMDEGFDEFEEGIDTTEVKFAQDDNRCESLSCMVRLCAHLRVALCVLSKIPQIKCATIEKLVEKLTYEKFPDTSYVQQFFLTYRSITSPLDLLELVIQRYCIVPPAHYTPQQSKVRR